MSCHVSALDAINEDALHQAQLLLGWVTFCFQETISVCSQTSQPPKSAQPSIPPGQAN